MVVISFVGFATVATNMKFLLNKKPKMQNDTAFKSTFSIAYKGRVIGTVVYQAAFDALKLAEGLADKLELSIDDYLFIYETRIAEFRANSLVQS